MDFRQLFEFLSNNTLDKYNLYKVYSSVFDLNKGLFQLGLDQLCFPPNDHIFEAMNLPEKLGEEFFQNLLNQLSEPYYDEIEIQWFNHCKLLNEGMCYDE